VGRGPGALSRDGARLSQGRLAVAPRETQALKGPRCQTAAGFFFCEPKLLALVQFNTSQLRGQSHEIALSDPGAWRHVHRERRRSESETITQIPQPTLNQGALGIGSEPGFGNPGAIVPANPDQINAPDLSGALPGEPGSPTYDPNAALPSLGNAGSALAPNPGTSAAGFNTPSVSSGTSPFSGTGG
jgi:hypothetical protein